MELRRRRRRASPAALDDAAFESRLVWIFGSPRSGSTWLLQLLVHPLVSSDDSQLGVKRLEAPDAGRPQAVPINEPYVPQHLTPSLFQAPTDNEDLATVTLNSFRHGDPNYFLSDHYAQVWRPQLRALILARLHAQARAVADEYGLRDVPVVVKEPNGSIGAQFVMSLLRRSRLLFLLRDGRDVVDSMLAAQLPGGWLARPGARPADDPAAERLRLVRRESALWLARTAAVWGAYETHPSELRRLVRYEDALAEPATTLRDLDDWLGLSRDEAARASALRWNDFDSYPADVKGPGMPLRAARPGLWRENMSRAEQAQMEEIMGARLAELSYAP